MEVPDAAERTFAGLRLPAAGVVVPAHTGLTLVHEPPHDFRKTQIEV
jgi:hypothetical protein